MRKPIFREDLRGRLRAFVGALNGSEDCFTHCAAMDAPSISVVARTILCCSYWTLRDLVLNGHIPAVRIPSPRARDGRVMRRILVDSRDLERLIERWMEGG